MQIYSNSFVATRLHQPSKHGPAKQSSPPRLPYMIGTHSMPVPDVPRRETVQATNFTEALSNIQEYWSPRVVGRVNDQYIKVAKLKGQLAWHKHDKEDELFQVVKGRLVIQFEGDREVVLLPGEFCVVPKGVMHNPVADEECWIVLIETMTTKHTGDVVTDRTRTLAEQLAGQDLT
jgi:mannose-6-phosphate isomerase-like protein (cupin superfamily)